MRPCRFSVSFGCAVVLLASSPLGVWAQDKTDKVEYRDPKTQKNTSRTGTIAEENVAKVTLLSGANKTKVEIPTSEIIDVVYDGEPGELLAGRNAEKNRDHEKALAAYQEALKKVPASNKTLHAHVQFKVLKLKAQAAETGAGAARGPVIDELRKFRTAYPEARQTLECLDLLSRLLTAEGQPVQEVVDAFKALRTKYADSKEIAARCDLFETQALITEGENLLKTNEDDAKKKYAAAQAKLQAMLAGADKSTALEIRVVLAVCRSIQGQLLEAVKELDELLKEASNDHTRATIHLGRGDCYRLTKQYRDAQWDYLWVDVIYNQDREQQAKALYCLSEVFAALGDNNKAKECKERLMTDPRLKDSQFQRLAARAP
jgi:tetratricopeptide (TPR) repeat protein